METTAERPTEKRTDLDLIIHDIEGWFEIMETLKDGFIQESIDAESYGYQISRLIETLKYKIENLREAHEGTYSR